MTLDLMFDLQCQIQCERTGAGYCPEITTARAPKWSETTASRPGQLTQPLPLAWHLTFQIKLNVKGRSTGYRTEITSARGPK